jgi:hypothetical protein
LADWVAQKIGTTGVATPATTRRAWQHFDPRLPLKIGVLAVVVAFSARLDSFFALWCHRNPVLDGRIPVQIAVLNDLANFEQLRVIGRSRPCLVCRVHSAL